MWQDWVREKEGAGIRPAHCSPDPSACPACCWMARRGDAGYTPSQASWPDPRGAGYEGDARSGWAILVASREGGHVKTKHAIACVMCDVCAINVMCVRLN